MNMALPFSEVKPERLSVNGWLNDLLAPLEENKENVRLVKSEKTSPKEDKEDTKENLVKSENKSPLDSKECLKSVLTLSNIKAEAPTTPPQDTLAVGSVSDINNCLIGATCFNYFDDDEEQEHGDQRLVLAPDFDLEGEVSQETDHGDNNSTSSEESLLLISHDDDTSSRSKESLVLIRDDNDNSSGSKESLVLISDDDDDPESPLVIKQERITKRMVIESESDDSSEDEISLLTKKFNKLPLPGVKQKGSKPPSKPQPPPQQQEYDPSNVKHDGFYGDVSRTVVKLAEIIETMPVPDDQRERDDDGEKNGLRVPLYDHQVYGLKWLVWREEVFPGGGILADEMGLGKTIMIIGLLMRTKMEGKQKCWPELDDDSLYSSRATLVVCPLGCLCQWEEEIMSKGKNLQVYLFHGSNRRGLAPRMLAGYDVVLTTYETVGNEIPKGNSASLKNKPSKRKSPLARIHWHRIVLDEAHKIRNPKTKSALSICSLASRHRWAVTGTPVHNYPEDFFSIVKFLQLKPFDEPHVWDYWIGKKTVKRGAEASKRLQTIGKALLLRRTKKEVESMGGRVRKIPPKTVEIIELELTEAEQAVYDHLMLFAQNMFQNFMQDIVNRGNEWERRAPPSDIRFSHLFALIIRLRQCAVLPHLIETMLEDEEVDENESFDEFKEEHLVSRINPVFDRLYESSKIKKILEDLEELRDTAREEERPMDKVIIVSSWTKLLDILYEQLKCRKFSSVYITGDRNIGERQEAMEKFNTRPKKPQILLLSLAAGGVGLNLIGGNHVFFVEPHWNPQLELQAQDRVHRFGQEKNVFIRRYISQGTIEQRVLELQDMKMDLAEGVLNNTKKSSSGGLTMQQMKLLFQT